MRLRDLREMIAKRQPLTRRRLGEPYELTPYDYTPCAGGKVLIHCRVSDGYYDMITMHADPSPTNDPLDAELR